MDSKFYVMYVVPIFITPIILDVLFSLWRNKKTYRLNDLTTNLSLSLLSTLSGLIVMVGTYAVYAYVNENFALLQLQPNQLLTWVVAFLGYDFCYYWAHRAHHRIHILWASHVVHHSGEDCNFGLALRQSVTGQLTFWIFFIPLSLLGINLEIYLTIAAFQLVYQYIIHTEYVKELGLLESVFITPSQHRVHHSNNPRYIDKNHGNVLVIWDRLFGTYERELASDPPVYGIRKQVNSWSPWRINVHEYATVISKIKNSSGVVDVVKCLFGPPEWMPEKMSSMLNYNDKIQVKDKNTKYDPTISIKAKVYSVLLFLSTFAAFIALLLTYPEWSGVMIGGAIMYILSSTYVVGAFLDGRSSQWKWEVGRQMVIITFISWVFAGGEVSNVLFYVVSAVTMTSLVFLVYMRDAIDAENGVSLSKTESE